MHSLFWILILTVLHRSTLLLVSADRVVTEGGSNFDKASERIEDSSNDQKSVDLQHEAKKTDGTYSSEHLCILLYYQYD